MVGGSGRFPNARVPNPRVHGSGEIPEPGPAQGMRTGGGAQVPLVEQGGESGQGIGGNSVHVCRRAPGHDQVKENVRSKKFGNAGAE